MYERTASLPTPYAFDKKTQKILPGSDLLDICPGQIEENNGKDSKHTGTNHQMQGLITIRVSVKNRKESLHDMHSSKWANYNGPIHLLNPI